MCRRRGEKREKKKRIHPSFPAADGVAIGSDATDVNSVLHRQMEIWKENQLFEAWPLNARRFVRGSQLKYAKHRFIGRVLNGTPGAVSSDVCFA